MLLHFSALKVIIILAFSILGMAGSYFVAWFGIRVNTLANSRAAYASLGGNPYRAFGVPLKSGMSIGMMLISIELLLMFSIILFVPGSYAGPCFIGFAIGESLGAAVLRLAGGIFTKIADIGADLMKIVFHVKEDDARNPGVIADCTGDNAGDSVGPTADGFETYGVVQVALIAFLILGAKSATVGVQVLVWLFAVRVAMLVAAVAGYYINEVISKARFGKALEFNFESPLTSLVWITSIVTIAVTYPVTYLLLPNLGGDPTLWWKLATITSCGTVAGALIPELVKVFTSTEARHVKEVVASAREGGAALGLLSGFVSGNYSAYYLGLAVTILMAIGYGVSTLGFQNVVLAAPMFAFGLVAFGFLGMGPVTIAVDSFGPVTDNAQSIYELSLIENEPDVQAQVKKALRRGCRFRARQEDAGGGRRRRQYVQSQLQAGADWHRGRGRHNADLRHHYGADQLADHKCGQALASARSVSAGPDHWRRGDLLVQWRFYPGRDHGRLPCRGVHQEKYED